MENFFFSSASSASSPSFTPSKMVNSQVLTDPTSGVHYLAQGLQGGGFGSSDGKEKRSEESESGKTTTTTTATRTNKKIVKPRYAFQTRSRVDILDDGYRWRKYGQKAVKNNTFPRSYYRCTHGGCNVKKQVQRLSKDEGVVVTTYEGMHNHQIERSTDNFEHILNQMQIYSAF